MTRSEAQAAIISDWRALPAPERMTEDQAARFAMAINDRYDFRSKADRYQVIKGWLLNHLAMSRS
jgi:hypothetical protein